MLQKLKCWLGHHDPIMVIDKVIPLPNNPGTVEIIHFHKECRHCRKEIETSTWRW